MKVLKSSLIVLFISLGLSGAWAAQWQLDPDHSEIRFKVNHILTPVSGHFTQFKGEMNFDPASPGSGRFAFSVSVKSVDTNNGKRDNHLKSKDFFNADKYPEMQFVSSKISHLRDDIYALEGQLTIKDVTRTLKTEFRFFAPKPHPFAKGKNVGGFITKFSIPRLDYNVGNGKFLKMGVVGGTVDVDIAVEALTPN